MNAERRFIARQLCACALCAAGLIVAGVLSITQAANITADASWMAGAIEQVTPTPTNGITDLVVHPAYVLLTQRAQSTASV